MRFPQELLATAEYARLFRVRPDTVRRAVTDGKFRGATHKVGTRRVFPLGDAWARLQAGVRGALLPVVIRAVARPYTPADSDDLRDWLDQHPDLDSVIEEFRDRLYLEVPIPAWVISRRERVTFDFRNIDKDIEVDVPGRHPPETGRFAHEALRHALQALIPVAFESVMSETQQLARENRRFIGDDASSCLRLAARYQLSRLLLPAADNPFMHVQSELAEELAAIDQRLTGGDLTVLDDEGFVSFLALRSFPPELRSRSITKALRLRLEDE